MHRRRLALIAAATCATAFMSLPSAAHPPSDNPLHTPMDKAVDAAATAYFSDSCRTGLSISAVAAEGARIYNYGVADRKRSILPTADSVYEIASVTKSFTASLAAMAVHEGKMTLEGDFRRYLSGTYPNLAADDHPVTLATLLTHRSGMPRDIPDSDAIFAAKNPRTLPTQLLALNRGRDESDFLRDLHHTALQGQPGKEERYSNAGFLLIGAGLEHVYRMPYASLLQERILTPLGMTSTTLTLSPKLKSRQVIGYNQFGEPAPQHPANAGAAWGLWSTPNDLARFVRWQLDETNPVIALSHKPLAHGDDEDIAMAWHVESLNGLKVISHGGGSFGASSQIVLFPQRDQGFALLANDTCKGTEGALKTFALTVERGL